MMTQERNLKGHQLPARERKRTRLRCGNVTLVGIAINELTRFSVDLSLSPSARLFHDFVCVSSNCRAGQLFFRTSGELLRTRATKKRTAVI